MRNFLRNCYILAALATLPAAVQAQTLYFPPTTGTNWDTMQPATLGWCPERIDTLYDYLQRSNTKAFILLKDGKIVLEQYFGTFTRDSAWYWASAGKALTAFTVGIAQQEGFLSIQDTTADYLGAGWTAAPAAKEEKITIWHQLTMTSGLNDNVPDHFCTLDTCLQYTADAGTRWAYHNGPYTLLDDVISQATGQTLNAYINQKIKAPTGMTGAFFPSGYNNVFVSTARSMARFGLLVLGRGVWNGTQVLSDTAYFNDMVNTSQNLNQSYGYLWWLNGKGSFMIPTLQTVFPSDISPAAPDDMFAAIGKDGQLINVVPSQNLVFVRMGLAPNTGDVSFLLMDTIWQNIHRLGDCAVLVERVDSRAAPAIVLAPNVVRAGDALRWQAAAPLREAVRWRVVDALGRQVASGEWQAGAQAGDIATADFPAGTYVLHLPAAQGGALRFVVGR